MEIRTNSKFNGQTLLTEKQWRQKRKIPMENCGIELWCNGYCQKTAKYYKPEEVRNME